MTKTERAAIRLDTREIRMFQRTGDKTTILLLRILPKKIWLVIGVGNYIAGHGILPREYSFAWQVNWRIRTYYDYKSGQWWKIKRAICMYKYILFLSQLFLFFFVDFKGKKWNVAKKKGRKKSATSSLVVQHTHLDEHFIIY